MACDCIDLLDAKLKADYGARLPVSLSLVGLPDTIGIQTHLIEKKRGARAPVLIAHYCPFCGVKYAAVADDTTEGDD